MNRLSRQQGVSSPKCSRRPFLSLIGACLVVAALPLAACGSATPTRSSSSGFTGYDWQVLTISHQGTATTIPARLHVVLRFSPDGQFGANDSVNFHGGTFRRTADGFTVSGMYTTLVGYAGHDPSILLAVDAIGSFNDGVHATVHLTGDRLVAGVGSYTLTCQRLGRQANLPAPSGTSG